MINIEELQDIMACEDGYQKFKAAHSDADVTITQALESNGIEDVCWYLGNTHKDYSHLDNTLRLFARKQALLNIELIKPYCGAVDYATIVHYLNTGESAARSAAWSAATQQLIQLIKEAGYE